MDYSGIGELVVGYLYYLFEYSLSPIWRSMVYVILGEFVLLLYCCFESVF